MQKSSFSSRAFDGKLRDELLIVTIVSASFIRTFWYHRFASSPPGAPPANYERIAFSNRARLVKGVGVFNTARSLRPNTVSAEPMWHCVCSRPSSRETHKHNVDANNESTTNINHNKVVDVLVVDKYEKTTVSACYSFNKYLCL